MCVCMTSKTQRDTEWMSSLVVAHLLFVLQSKERKNKKNNIVESLMTVDVCVCVCVLLPVIADGREEG